ncbi:unnamed protein product, partial [Brenthis ino]
MSTVYDRLLVEIGNEDTFQKRFDLVHNTAFMFFWNMVFTNIMLALTIVPHMCELPEKPANISQQDWKLLYIPSYRDDSGRQTFDECRIHTDPYESNFTKACDKFIYDKTWYEWTVSSEFNWICDKELNIVNILAYSKLGEIIGAFCFGWFGDVYGRRLTYFISILMIIVGRLISLLAGNSYIIFLIGCLIANLPSWSAPQTGTIISTEISSPRRRTVMTGLRFTSSSLSLVVSALTFWYTIESPRWLYTRGRHEEAARILKKIAKVNKKQIDDKTEKELMSTVLGEKKDGNPFLDFAWQAIADIPAIFLGGWLADKIGRRYSGVSSLGVLGLMWACIAFRENSVDGWIRQWWIGSIFTTIARVATSVGFVIINIFNIELHPTCLRQSGLALGNSVSGISAASTPYILYLGRRVDSRLPGIILTVTSLTGALSSYLLPETLNVPLPETIEEAKLFGQKNKTRESVKLTTITS